MMDYADEYALVDRAHWWFQGRQALIVGTLRRYVRPGSRLLDVGCGTGGLSAELARHYAVEAVDASSSAVAIARGRGVAARQIEPGAGLGTGYDVACAFDVLEHVDDDVGLVRQLEAAVRLGGMVAVTVPALPSLWGPMDELGGHRRRYRLRGLTRVMAAAGVRRVYATYFNLLLLPGMALARLAGFPRPGRELAAPVGWVNRVLRVVFTGEAHLVARVPAPLGSSILFVGSRPSGTIS